MMIRYTNRLTRSACWVAMLLLAPVSMLFAADDNDVLTGDEVTGKNVVAVWQFKPGAELTDGKGDDDLTLKGNARVVKDDRFGGVLDCPGTPKGEDKPHGAFTKWNPDVAVEGPFTVEAWVKLKEKPADPKWRSGYIVDKTYVPRTHKSEKLNKDFYFKIDRDAGGTRIRLQGGVGLGDEVIGFTSEQVKYQPGKWQHMVFCYNGAGTGMLFIDGKLIGKKTYPGKGAAASGTRYLSIGERSGSLYNGLPACIAQVRIMRGLPEMVSLIDLEVNHQFGRTAFERMEDGAEAQVTLKSVDGRIISGVTLNVDDGIGSREILVGELSAKPRTVTVPIRTDGRAGAYTMKVSATGQLKDEKARGAAAYKYHLCNRLPEFMPIVMWGGASFELMEKTGFTHYLQWMDHVDAQAWTAGEPIDFVSRFDDVRDKANEALVRGLRLMGKISPGGYFKHQEAYAEARKDYLVYDRSGQPGNMVDFSLPRVQQFGFDVGRSVANNVGMFPAVDLVIADSEFRDAGRLSFRPETREAFRKHAGFDIPEAVRSKTGVKYNRLPDFPRDRVIADDNPILVYYKWLWGGGDGYPGMLSHERKGLTPPGSHIRMLWDPAVRCPSKWGSGGTSDFIGHWTYVYPDPLVMGLAADELFAMVKGGPDYQQVVKMTQVIWYRSGTTGKLPEDKSKWTEWEKRLPEAKFITIPPDMAEIALWQKLSRPVRSIMYHGAGSLWPSQPGGYDFTHPGTERRLASLFGSVVKPFGPMLLAVPDRPARVAMLESFTSQMFYGGITWGTMRSPTGRMHGVLTRAHLQPDVVYDETIVRDGLAQYKVLVMPTCPVLTRSVVDKVKAWQARGGIVVGDELLSPAITPDVLIRQVETTDKAESAKKAKQLRTELGQAYLPYAEADTHEAILRVRSAGSTDYVFAFNDKRTWGDYVGQYRKVMEKGLPLEAKLKVRRPRGTVYDLLAGKAVEANVVDGALVIDAGFGPGQGRMYMITERPIAGVTVKAPPRARRTGRVVIDAMVNDAAGNPIDAVVPLHVEVTDPTGNAAEFSGYHAARAGKLALQLDIAPNDAVGAWTVTVRELASGKRATAGFRVE